MNLSIILKEATANQESPLSKNDRKVMLRIIKNAEYSGNGFLLLFDFTPYLKDKTVNLFNIEYFVDLYILANRLCCSLTKNAPTEKLFFSPYMANSKMFGFMPRDKANIQIYEADADLYLASYEENSDKGCCLDKEMLKAFFKGMQKGFYGVVERPQTYCTLDVILCRDLQNQTKLLRYIQEHNLFPADKLEELEKKDKICDFLEYYFSNYRNPSIFSRTSFRNLTPDTMILYDRQAGKKLSELSEFDENHFRSGCFVTRQGRIVSSIKKVKTQGIFYNGEDKLVDPEVYCPFDCKNAKFSERIVGIMIDDANFLEIRENYNNGVLKYEYLVEQDSKAERRLPYIGAGYPKPEHYVSMLKNMETIDAALCVLEQPSMKSNIAADGQSCIVPFIIRNYTNGYFYEG